MSEQRKRLGERGEDAAATYLSRSGMTVVERNWRCKSGEVDIIALDDDVVVLCEVKTRRTSAKGTPEASITPAKQRKYERLARAYLAQANISDVPVRFDVISIRVIAEDRALLRHLRAAFVPEAS